MQVQRVSALRNITPEALQAQSRLLQTLGQIKAYLPTHRSQIIKRRNDCGGVIGKFCYFKIGEQDKASKQFDSSTAFMESIMWDIAVILKMTSNFVPTGLIRFNYAKRTVERINAKGEQVTEDIFEVTNVNKRNVENVIASFQPAQAGRNLHLDDVVPDEEFANTLIYSLILGQFDHHFNNVLKNRNNELFSFDNTLSFAAANGILKLWNLNIIRSVRPSFLGTKNGSKPLTYQLKQLCLSLLLKSRSEVNSLRAYFSSYIGKKKLSCLKPGWMDVEKSIAALLQRLDILEKALKSDEIRTFRDLVLSAFEDYRITVASQIILKRDSSKDAVFIYDGEDIEDSLKKVFEKGYSSKEFRFLIDNYTHYEEWFDKLRQIRCLNKPDEEGLKYVVELVASSSLECKGDIKSEKYFSKLLLKQNNWPAIFTNAVGERVITFNEQSYSVDIVSRPGKIIVKAHRGELPPLAYEKLDEGIPVLNFLKEIEEEQIPFKLACSKTKERQMFSLEDYSYYIEQISGAESPSFSIVYKTIGNPRIIPLKVLDVQVLKLLIPPRVKPLTTTVEIEYVTYECKVDYLNRLLINLYDGYLPRMTKEEFDLWVKGPKIEKDILLTVSLLNNKCLFEEELSDELNKIEDYLIVQLMEKPTLQFRLLNREKRGVVVYDLQIERDIKEKEDIFVLTDKDGKVSKLSSQEFSLKIKDI